MIGIPSAPYNDLDNQLYAGSLTSAARGLRKAWSYTPVGRLSPVLKKAWSYTPVGRLTRSLTGRHFGTKRIRGSGLYRSDTGEVVGGGWGDYDDELFGGRTRRRRRATAKQLRALARGRAKLRAMRRLSGGKLRRRKARRFRSRRRCLRGGALDIGDMEPTRLGAKFSQERADDAAMELMKITRALKDSYDFDTDDPIYTAKSLDLVRQANNLLNYLNRALTLGYEPTFEGWKLGAMSRMVRNLGRAQNSNRVSRSERYGLVSDRAIARAILKERGLPAGPGDVTRALRRAKTKLYEEEEDVPVYKGNVFQAADNDEKLSSNVFRGMAPAPPAYDDDAADLGNIV